MTPRAIAATVVVPTTGDRAPLLELALESLRAQTVADLEIVVAGDGAGDGTRALLARVAAEDPRVRFADHPKGDRRGEERRHALLLEARGRIVAYMCDRDLALPDHVETLLRLLENADFAHTFVSRIAPGRGPEVTVAVDLADPRDRAWALSGWAHENGVPLSFVGHTMDAYGRLPHGWRATPPGRFTDIHMWEQFLAEPWCRVVSGARPTLLYFPAYLREGWSVEEKRAELAAWRDRLRAPGGVEAVREAIAVAAERDRTERARRLREREPAGPLRRLDGTLRHGGRAIRDRLLALRNAARRGRDARRGRP